MSHAMWAVALAFATVGSTPGDDLAETIVKAGHKKVGVIPSVISRSGDVESTVGTLGPRGRTLAHDLHRQLVKLSNSPKYRGKFTVISERVMRQAMQDVAGTRGVTIADLGNPRALEAIAKYTGADGFVTLDFDERPELLNSKPSRPEDDAADKTEDESAPEKDKPIDTTAKKRKPFQEIGASYVDQEGAELAGNSYRDVNTLSSAAYMGDSFELRRFSGDTLLNVGLRTDHPQFAEDTNWLFGKGERWEREQFGYLKSEIEHPLASDAFPYGVRILVGGKERELTAIGGKYLVELNEGENYSIYLDNKTSQPAMVALYVDGVSTIDKELREPLTLENARHWVLKPDFTAAIDGWYRIDQGLKVQKGERFNIVSRENSEAGKQGFNDNLGMITAIFYVNDVVSGQYVNYPDDALLEGLRAGFAESQFGTGAGDEFERELNFTPTSRGLMLADLP